MDQPFDHATAAFFGLERTSTSLAVAWAEGRVGSRRTKLDAAKRREIAKSVITGREIDADMARLYGAS